MSIYDVVMIIVLLGAVWFGYRKGLAWQVASVAAICLSYFVAVTFPDVITPYISAEAPFNRFAAMLILFVGTSLIVWTLFASVSKSLKKLELKGFDRQAGALVGGLKGALLCMVITMFAVALLGDSARNAIWQSKTGYYVVQGIDKLPGLLPAELAQHIHTYVENFQQGIVDERGNLPGKNPIFNGDQTQQVNGQNQFRTPASNYQYSQPNNGVASQAGFQYSQPTNTGQTQGSYQSGTFGNSNNGQVSGGYQQGTFGGGTTAPPQYRPSTQPTQYQQPQSQNRTQWQPPAGTNPSSSQGNAWGNQFPKITNGENGWPDVQFNVNSKELLQRGAGAALDASKQWLDAQQR